MRLKPGCARTPTWLKFEKFEFEIVSSLGAFAWMKPSAGLGEPLARGGKTPAFSSSMLVVKPVPAMPTGVVTMLPPPCISIRVT